MSVSRRFLLLGEPLALDLVNTRIRRDGVNVDLLDKPAALTAWLQAGHGRGVVRAASRPGFVY